MTTIVGNVLTVGCLILILMTASWAIPSGSPLLAPLVLPSTMIADTKTRPLLDDVAPLHGLLNLSTGDLQAMGFPVIGGFFSWANGRMLTQPSGWNLAPRGGLTHLQQPQLPHQQQHHDIHGEPQD